MDFDLVDGTLYFQSKDPQSEIYAWYTRQFQKINYSSGGSGQLGDREGTTSDWYDFNRNGSMGQMTRYPAITLGFLSQQQNGKTLYELEAQFIVVPPRPQDTYLPTDIVKVVLTKGTISKAITNQDWISKVVHNLNTLQVTTPGISSGGPAAPAPGTPTTIDAKFYRKDGTVIEATYFFYGWTLQVGNDNVLLSVGPSPALDSELESVFAK